MGLNPGPGSGTPISVTDGITTIAAASTLTLPAHSLTDGGSGNAELGYITADNGGQEALHVVATSGAAQTVSPLTANVWDITLTANCTITLGAAGAGGSAITVILRQDGTGSRLVTWPVSVSWVAGSAPVLKTAAAAQDLVTLFTEDGGTTWGGTAVSNSSGISDASNMGGPTVFDSLNNVYAAFTSVSAYLTVRFAAGVPSGAPTGTEIPIAFDSTAVSGGVYYWTGSAWVKGGTI